MNKIVMVVDDSQPIRKFVTFALRAQGCKVVTAVDGMDALEKLSRQKIDLIITDLNMPNLDGFELMRAVREDQVHKEVPIIILSSLKSKEDIEMGRKLGAHAYLIKPFDQKRIQYEVAKILN